MARFVYKVNKYVNGIDYDKDRDYAAEMNEAKKKGDTDLLAQLEDERNKKIEGENLPYRKTYDYIDIGTKIEEGIRNRVSPAEIKELVDARRDKAYQNGQYDIYKSDEIQKRGLKYYYDAESGVGQMHEERPTEQRSYDAEIRSLLNKISNARNFEYDLESDPVYTNLRNQMRNESRRAATDVLADIQQQSGGKSSYAATAASLAANNYNAKLTEQIPRLYELAFERYQGGLENQQEALDYALRASDAEHERYQDSLEQYNRDREYANESYENALDRYMEEDQRKFDADMELAEFNYQKERDQREADYERFKDEQEAQAKRIEDARDLVMHYEEGGVSAVPELLEDAQMSDYQSMNEENASLFRRKLDLDAIAAERDIAKTNASIAKAYNDMANDNQRTALANQKFAYQQEKDKEKSGDKEYSREEQIAIQLKQPGAFLSDLSKYKTVSEFAKQEGLINPYTDEYIEIDGIKYTLDDLKEAQRIGKVMLFPGSGNGKGMLKERWR